jgi:hypothetical protein
VKFRSAAVDTILVIVWIVALLLCIPLIALISIIATNVAMMLGINLRGEWQAVIQVLLPIIITMWFFVVVVVERGINELSDHLDRWVERTSRRGV